MKNHHSTPLTYHIQSKHLWLDVSLLIIIWVISFLTPQKLNLFIDIPLSSIIKISAIIASLELLGFLTYHLVREKSSILLQGFLGGLVSSTATFVQLTRDSVFAQASSSTMKKSLILATLAMLIECLFISFTIRPHDFIVPMRPILIQMIILVIAFFINPNSKHENTNSTDSNVLIDHPILWKNVLKLSLIVLLLIVAIQILEKLTALPLFWSSLLVSIIEAHATLAAGLSTLGPQAGPKAVTLIVIAVILGNSISKIFFIVRAKNKSIKKKAIIPFALSALIPVVDYLLF